MCLSFARGIRCIFATAALLAVFATPSRALETRDLAGWWIAIDKTFPALWERGTIVAMEELLIVAPDGRAENRGMGFFDAATDCMPDEPCTDAPLIATAQLAMRGASLMVSNREEPRQRINTKEGDLIIRRIAVTATAQWTVAVDGGVMALRSTTENLTRTFVRIDPNRLRRLRAGLMLAEKSAAEHWRCFLANATVNDRAFATLRRGSIATPSFLEGYLRIASYRATLSVLGSLPMADSPDPQRQQLARRAIENLMIERFDDAPPPGNAAEAGRLLATAQWIDAVARGVPATAAAEEISARTKNTPLDVTVPESDVAALARVRKAVAPDNDDAEVKKLFCLQ